MKRHKFNLLFIVFMALSGCALDKYVHPEEPGEYLNIGAANHALYNATQGASNFWVGRGVARLVTVRGEPDLIIDTIPRGVSSTEGMRTVGYVYGLKSGTEGKCIDAYVVSLDTGTILRYHCR